MKFVIQQKTERVVRIPGAELLEAVDCKEWIIVGASVSQNMDRHGYDVVLTIEPKHERD